MMADISVSSPGVGSWVPLELAEAVETQSGSNKARVRTEQWFLRLAGLLKIKSGHEAAALELLALLPPPFREKPPVSAIRLIAINNENELGRLSIETNNGQILFSRPLKAGMELYLDSLHWPTT